MKNYLFLLWMIVIFACNTSTKRQSQNHGGSDSTIIYVGTYTQQLPHVHGKASGIYVCMMHPETGGLQLIDSATDIVNPSFLAVSPNQKYLYAVSELDGKNGVLAGKVVAYRIGQRGKLTKINERLSYGNAPCHVSTDPLGRFVFVANYVTGNVTSYGVAEDGSLTDSLCTVTQYGSKASWAHQIIPTPDGKHLLSCNKGADRVLTYTYNNGILQPSQEMQTEENSGPRHFTFSPTNKTRGFLINENNSTTSSYHYDTLQTSLRLIHTLSTLPKQTTKNSGADIHVHPNGAFVYASNRGDNSIAIYQIMKDGKLTPMGWESTQGEIPRNFMISRNGKFLVIGNQNSDNILVLSIDGTTGKLKPIQKISIMTPVCIVAL